MSNTMKKVVVAAFAALLVICLSVAGTFAYLTYTSHVKNVFTVGKVDATLTEEGGSGVSSGENKFPLEPKTTPKKDAKVKIGKGSMDAYVFVELDPVCTAATPYNFASYISYEVDPKADGTNTTPAWAKVGGTNDNVWYIKYTKNDSKDVTYRFFKDGKITVKDFDNAAAAALADKELSLTVYAGAIQDSTDFSNALAAWKALAGDDQTLTK